MSVLVAHLMELVDPLQGVSVRRMFSGSGLFRDGRMFAIVIDETVYVKSDVETASHFDAEDLEPFSYDTKLGRRVLTSYRRLPERCLDDSDECLTWMRRGLDAAERVAEPRKRPAKAAKR